MKLLIIALFLAAGPVASAEPTFGNTPYVDIQANTLAQCQAEWNQQLLRLFLSLSPDDFSTDQPLELAVVTGSVVAGADDKLSCETTT